MLVVDPQHLRQSDFIVILYLQICYMMTIKWIVTIKSEKKSKSVAELGKFVRCELLVARIVRLILSLQVNLA